MKRIGLTGGIATGKSTVARWLRERGVPVIDADQLAREVVAPGSPCLASIVATFGTDILRDDGQLDRARMRQRIAEDPRARRTLEGITHPAIFAAMQRELNACEAQGHPVAVVEAALMVETGSYTDYDELLVVTCSPRIQLSRLLARDGTTARDAKRLIDAQLPLARKEEVASCLLVNDGSVDELHVQLAAQWPKLSRSSDE